MAFEQIRLDRPLSRLELAVMVVLIAVCAGWFLNRVAFLEAVAEARALELTVRSLRTGIMVYVSMQLLQGGRENIAALAESNPVGLVVDPPAGYIGALRQANPANILPGQWYFDEDGKFLAYHVVNSDYFESGGDGLARVRIQLELNYDDSNGNSLYDPDLDSPLGVSLQLVDPPKWTF